LPREDRTLATLAVILLHILALVDMAGCVALVVVPLVVVPLVVVPLVVVPLVVVPLVVVPLVVVPLVVVAIATTKYSNRFIDGNRIIGTSSKQFIQGLLLVKQLTLLVKKLLNHCICLARWSLDK